MKLVVDLPGLPGEHVTSVQEALHLAGFDATVEGAVKPEFEALVPYIVGEAK